jgi:hypothetical protein
VLHIFSKNVLVEGTSKVALKELVVIDGLGCKRIFERYES